MPRHTRFLRCEPSTEQFFALKHEKHLRYQQPGQSAAIFLGQVSSKRPTGGSEKSEAKKAKTCEEKSSVEI